MIISTRLGLLFTYLLGYTFSSPCIVFDSNFNLYIFGRGGNNPDLSLGPQTSWSSPTITTLSSTGRPDFSTNNTQCALSQYVNILYAFVADSKSPSSLYVYDPTSKQWSTQTISNPSGGNGPNPFTMTTILDHDTNSYYAYDNGQLFELDLNTLTKGSSTPIPYQLSNLPSFQGSAYPQATVGIGQNHLHFIGTPNSNQQIQIFVIHFAYWQPALQAYPITSGGSGNPPSTHGKTASFLDSSNGVPIKFAYIPDDGSGIYVINVNTNSTAQFPPPPIKDSKAVYAANPTTLVQYTSQGQLYYLDISASNPSWTQIKSNELSLTSISNSTSSALSPTNTGTGTGSGSTSSNSSSSSPTASGVIKSRTVSIHQAGLTIAFSLFVIFAF